ncbi:hypothetical protein V5O48_006102 [Marasmius crinis-equi]|uniref:F-box domain-containing protein n=1 Tax=Marasmius crinis-equi TaxID=585013 RepID=A0ABR3FKG0_9AGAR
MDQESEIQNQWLGSDERLLKEQDKEIAFLERAVQKMYAGRAIVQSRIQRRRCLKGAIRRVPVEVLRIIFQMACSDVVHDWHHDPRFPIVLFQRDSKNIPGDLAQVCYLWKDIVYNFSDLWDTISFELPNSPAKEEHLQSIVDRSGSRLLTLAVEAGPWILARSPPPLIVGLSEALSRARVLDISFDIVSGMDLRGVTYLHLKELHLHVHSAFDQINRYAYSRRQVQALVQAPSLESFSTDDFSELGRDGTYPTSTISTFRCSGAGAGIRQAHLTELAIRCPEIRSLTVMLRGTSFRQTPSQPALLPRLERLIFTHDTSDHSLFLDSIVGPSLTELVLPTDPSEEFIEGLVRFIDRSGCRLRVLDCSFPWGFDGSSVQAGWGAIFERLPDLESLRVKLTANLTWHGKDGLDDLCSVLLQPNCARRLTSLRVSAIAGGWRDLEMEEMEDVARRFLSLAESRAPDNHAPTIVPLQEAALHLDTSRYNGWGVEVGSIPLPTSLEQRRLALEAAGMHCEVFFPAIS